MKFDGDRILGLSAMVVGVASLTVVVYQAQLQRDQTELEQRAAAASVLPYLMVVATMNDEGVFINVRNAGIGPARIERVRVLHKGGDVTGDAFDFYEKMRSDPDLPHDIDQLKPGRLVPAGEWVRMLGTGNAASKDRMQVELLRLFQIAELPPSMYERYDKELAEQAKRVAEPAKPAAKQAGTAPVIPVLKPREKAVLEVTYSSVFGEQWILRSDDIIPKPLTPARQP